MGLLLQIADLLAGRYSLAVEPAGLRDESEMVGWSNGRIHYDPNSRVIYGAEFMVCHVFGHLAQYSMRGRSALELPAGRLDRRAYERREVEASGIGRSLLRASGVHDRDTIAHYDAWCRADLEYYWAFLNSGRADADLMAELYREELANKSAYSSMDLQLPHEIAVPTNLEVLVA